MKCVNYKRPCLYTARLLTILAGSLLFSAHAGAQRYPFHNISVDDGLIQSQATSLTQDKLGNLWIGTLGGLSRYDGHTFTNYTVRNGLLSNVVNAVAADTEGNIWASGPGGIVELTGHINAQYTLPRTATRMLSNSQQISIVSDTTWWRAQGDVYFITKGKIKYFITPGPAGAASAIMAERGGLWVAKGGIIYHHYNNKWDTLSFALPPDQRLPGIYRIFRDKSGGVWVTTNSGLFKADSSRIVAYMLNGQPLTYLPGIASITQDKAGAIWLGMASGVYKLSGNMLQAYNKRNGLSDNTFSDILTDLEGNVWMASDGQGLFRFSGTQFTGLDETMGLPSAQVMSIASNKRDSLFLGTYDAGMYIFKDGKVSELAFPINPKPTITSMLHSRGKLWIGTRGQGLWTYQHDIFRQYLSPERRLPSNYVNTIYEDAAHRIWIGFPNGVVLFENDSFKTITTKNNWVISFLAIGADSILMATENNGLELYSGGIVTDYITNTIADSSSVKCLIIRGRELWMGSSDNGVIRYNMDTRKVQLINKASGLRSDFIYNIIADNDNNVWVGTGFGIHKITIEHGGEPHITFYGKAQGLTGMESNLNAVLRLPDGSVWFGTTNGALHYQPHTDVVATAPVSIVLQSVKLAGDNTIDHSYYDSTDSWYSIPYHLRLPYQKNTITLTYGAITLSGEQQVLYRYRMDGLEAPWSDWAATNSVTYSALPPGHYIFHVQCQPAGKEASPELTYAFEIITPFQKTNWFRLLVLAACLLTGIMLQYIANYRKERRQRLLEKLRAEEQAKIRARTAEDFHDEVGNKLTRINILTNVLKSKIAPTPDTTRILGQIQDNAGQLYSGTRDILWSLQPANDNLYEILYRIRDFGMELFQDTEIIFTFEGNDEKWRTYRLAMDMSRNLIMIFKEALNNTLKYAQAHHVSLTVNWKNKGILQLVLKDDGEGFDMATAKKGNGINNMQVRTERLKGKLYIDSRKNKGTIINLTFKIPPNR